MKDHDYTLALQLRGGDFQEAFNIYMTCATAEPPQASLPASQVRSPPVALGEKP